MQVVESLSGFTMSLVFMLLIPMLEEELSKGYRLEFYKLDAHEGNRVYGAFQNNQLAVELVHKMMLFSILFIPSYLMWNYIGYLYAPPIFVMLVFLYRRSFGRLVNLLPMWEKQRIDQLVSGLI